MIVPNFASQCILGVGTPANMLDFMTIDMCQTCQAVFCKYDVFILFYCAFVEPNATGSTVDTRQNPKQCRSHIVFLRRLDI
jgi:hypothetical protein